MSDDLRIIIAKLDAITQRQSDIHDRVGRVDDSVGRIDDRVSDLTTTVINHINSDISTSNKKSLKSTPNWMVFLLVFFLGRLSIDIANLYDQTQKPQTRIQSQSSEFYAPSSTIVDQKKTKTTNQRINKRIVESIIGKED